MRALTTGLLAALGATLGITLSTGAAEAGPRREAVFEGPAVPAASGRAPWNTPWEYDSGSDNDRRPELPYYQQGRGQQTGGPARNLLPDDGVHLFPR
ncbi:hypothetical protein [Methylorubrum suomiense]|jgi:hypothetical protein|uniref:Uncharacterized protein n=1 Tax=Methylorubrum suomiense TaxID=144191 RepID=A0ABQ4UQF2_9HYPH|nr:MULTISPECIES: hypothetical protein [Methylobacteriaceae]GJE74553.1 hypothetical protein BGCPKDLD_1124 [Methylorubrum suomiense]